MIAYVGTLGTAAILPKDGNRYHLGPNVGKVVVSKEIEHAKFFLFFFKFWINSPIGKGMILILSAGTSDIPVAREAFLTASEMGNTVKSVFDVGVVGIHRGEEDLQVVRGRVDARHHSGKYLRDVHVIHREGVVGFHRSHQSDSYDQRRDCDTGDSRSKIHFRFSSARERGGYYTGKITSQLKLKMSSSSGFSMSCSKYFSQI